jgi:hypothetical protein
MVFVGGKKECFGTVHLPETACHLVRDPRHPGAIGLKMIDRYSIFLIGTRYDPNLNIGRNRKKFNAREAKARWGTRM